MASRDEVLAYVDGYLEVSRFRDYGPQGLQVEGRADVRRLVTGVSASMTFFEKAAAAGADMALVHHGMFWRNEAPVVVAGPLAARLRFLLEHEITLAGYHLPLDAHPEVGNNALAARDLGAVDLEPWGEADGQVIGWRGRFADPVRAKDLFRRIGKYYDREPLVFAHGPAEIASVGIVSGAGQSFLRQAVRDGLDCFVTGEASEWNMAVAQEAKVHFVSAGHHATERVGIRALGEHVAQKFGLAHEFIDVPNPV